MPCFMQRNGPFRFKSKTRATLPSAQSISDEQWISIAAEHTRASSRPCRSPIASSIATTSPSLVTSTVIASASSRPSAATRLSATCCARGSSGRPRRRGRRRSRADSRSLPRTQRALGETTTDDGLAVHRTPPSRRRRGRSRPTCSPTRSLARNGDITAMSSGMPTRRSHVFDGIETEIKGSSRVFGDLAKKRGMSIEPGCDDIGQHQRGRIRPPRSGT